MRASPKMRRVIEQLAATHEVNLQEQGAFLRLELSGFDRLVMRRWGLRLLSVAQFFEAQGLLVAKQLLVSLPATRNKNRSEAANTSIVSAFLLPA